MNTLSYCITYPIKATLLAKTQAIQDIQLKFFVPFEEATAFTDAFVLRIAEGEKQLVEFKCKLGLGDEICMNRTKDFSYNSTDGNYTLRFIRPDATKLDFYLEVTSEHFSRLYEFIVCV